MPLRSLIVAAAAAVAVGLAAPGVAQAGAPATSPYVAVLESSRELPQATTERLQRDIGFIASRRYAHAVRGFAAKLTPAQVRSLRAHPAVAHVVPDIAIAAAKGQPKQQPVQPEVTPAGVRRIDAAGDGGRGPADGAVAVLDTGLDLSNPELNAVDGTNCIKSGKSAQDDNGHGTHIGGTIGARADGRGVVGVAPGTRMYAVKVLDSNSTGRLSALLCGVEWVKANAARLNIRVVNVSIAASGSDDGACGSRNGDPLHAAICSSVAAGIVYVAAAGNSATDFARTIPAAYSETLAVTAMTDTDGLAGGHGGASCDPVEQDDRGATYSNFATGSDAAAHTIAGPGTCVTSSRVGGGATTMTGTSMAAPHVTAAAALCLGSGGDDGPCRSADPAQRGRVVVERLRADAADAADDGFGFAGDPLDPIAEREMGHLVSIARY